MSSLSHRTVFQVLRSHTRLPHWTAQPDPPAVQTVLGSIAAEVSERPSLQNRCLNLDVTAEQPLASGKGGRKENRLAEESSSIWK